MGFGFERARLHRLLKVEEMRCSGRAGLQARVKALCFCHPERTLVREGSAFSTGKKNDSGKRWLAVMLRGTLWLVLL
jgi:hypothetical protein